MSLRWQRAAMPCRMELSTAGNLPGLIKVIFWCWHSTCMQVTYFCSLCLTRTHVNFRDSRSSKTQVNGKPFLHQQKACQSARKFTAERRQMLLCTLIRLCQRTPLVASYKPQFFSWVVDQPDSVKLCNETHAVWMFGKPSILDCDLSWEHPPKDVSRNISILSFKPTHWYCRHQKMPHLSFAWDQIPHIKGCLETCFRQTSNQKRLHREPSCCVAIVRLGEAEAASHLYKGRATTFNLFVAAVSKRYKYQS